MIGIGIDTGGTCTDAVVLDTKTHQVLSQSKTLTTRQDLKIGILKALRGLDAAAAAKAQYISLSTTPCHQCLCRGQGRPFQAYLNRCKA